MNFYDCCLRKSWPDVTRFGKCLRCTLHAVQNNYITTCSVPPVKPQAARFHDTKVLNDADLFKLGHHQRREKVHIFQQFIGNCYMTFSFK